jgi:hypothetical protein
VARLVFARWFKDLFVIFITFQFLILLLKIINRSVYFLQFSLTKPIDSVGEKIADAHY